MVNRFPNNSTKSRKGGDGSTTAEMVTKQITDTKYEIVRDESQLQSMVSEITNAGSFAFDTETTSTHPMSANLVGVSLSISQGQGWYIPVGHINEDQLALEKVLTAIRPLLESDDLGKSAHNANFDMLMLRNYGIIPNLSLIHI